MFSARRWRFGIVALLVLAVGGHVATPYLRAASLLVRTARMGGRIEAFATSRARAVTIRPAHMVTTRHGDAPAQFYEPGGPVRRTILMIPGIHSMGIQEPRLRQLARDLAGSGVRVMTLELPDLVTYRITPNATDVIEDAVAWMATQPRLAPDGRVGLVGVSFAGGLSIVAAGRPAIRDKLAFLVSFGGHGDLPRVMRYLATGQEVSVPGVQTHPPHDYGVAVILFGLADQGMVPPDQVEPLRHGIRTFLLASQLTLVDMHKASATFAEARALAATLPEPAATYLRSVNDRSVEQLGPVLASYLDALGADNPALSPERAPEPPAAPIFLLHGHEDTVIPPVESVLLDEYLRERGTSARLLLSGLITHAELDRASSIGEAWKLIAFWADVLRR